MTSPRQFPIIFSSPMIRALLDGRKTMTRRLVTPRSSEFGSIPNGKLTKLYWEHADWANAFADGGFPDPSAGGAYRHGYLHVPCHDRDDEAEIKDSSSCDLCFERGWAGSSHRLYPRVQPGDLLLVKEAWRWHKSFDHRKPSEAYFGMTRQYGDGPPAREMGKLRNARFMPKVASRLTLKVTAVRIERLNEISAADAEAEGVFRHIALHSIDKVFRSDRALCAVQYFRELWDSINGQRAGCTWADNPWVTVTTFDVIKANIADVIAGKAG